MNVYIRKQDIADGVRGSDQACPVALALGRQEAPGTRVWVFSPQVYVAPGEHDDPRLAFELSPTAMQFVRDFDNGYVMCATTLSLRRLRR